MLANNKFKLVMLVVMLVLGVSLQAAAGFSPRTIGLGDEFSTLTGDAALYGNPAGVNAGPDIFTLELGGGARFWNNLLYNDYISDEEKDKLLTKIENNGGFLTGVEGRAGPKLIAGPVGGFADLRAEGLAVISSDVAEILLSGNEIGKEYELAGTNGAGGLYADGGVNISLASPKDLIEDWQDVDDLYVGFTYHQLAGVIARAQGNGKMKVDYSDDEDGPAFTSEGGNFRVEYNNPEEALASGSAVDLGAYANLGDKYGIGVSAMNIGALSSSARGNYFRKYEAEYDNSGNITGMSEGEEQPLNESLEWQLPATYRLGGKMEVTDSIVIMSDYSYTKYYGYETNYEEHKIAAATEITWLNFLPLRTGLNYSTQQGVNWAGGLGLHLGPLKVDAGVSDLLGAFNKSRKVEAAITGKIQF
jgi:hypothetical protein